MSHNSKLFTLLNHRGRVTHIHANKCHHPLLWLRDYIYIYLTITLCLGLGLETMVCAVCLFVFFLLIRSISWANGGELSSGPLRMNQNKVIFIQNAFENLCRYLMCKNANRKRGCHCGWPCILFWVIRPLWKFYVYMDVNSKLLRAFCYSTKIKYSLMTL